MIGTAADQTFLALCLPFLAALVAPLCVRVLRHHAAWLLALFPALSFLHILRFGADIAKGEAATGGYVWVPSYNLSFSWYIDGLSFTFALLITGIGALVVLYAGGYLKGHANEGRFLSFLFLFMGSMLGLVVSDSFLMFFIFWELTSIASFLLIGFDHEREAARRAALQALVVTGGGGLALLAGLLIVWNVSGVTQISLLVHLGDILRDSPFYLAILILLLAGAFTKSAQFPFHFWLPNAMEAPAPVSAYLHSATMVKAGIFLLLRFYPAIGGTPAFGIILPVFGGLTMAIGAVLALRQSDLKLMLAYTTVSSLGLLTVLIGIGSQQAIAAAVLYLVAHALFKAALFMVAGILDHETGSRDVSHLRGLAGLLPMTFSAGLVAALSMGGLPPFLGFIAKEEVYAALFPATPGAAVLLVVAICANALMFAAAFAVGLKPFAGRRFETAKSVHEGPLLLWLPALLLALCGLSAGLLAGPFAALVASPMTSAVLDSPVGLDLSPLPHIGLPLLLSLLTILLGSLVFLSLGRVRAGFERLIAALGPGPDQAFDEAMAALTAFCVRLTRFLQPGRLSFYVTTAFASLALILLATMALYREWPRWPVLPPDLCISEMAVMAIAVAGVAAVVLSRGRLTAIVALGIQGFAVAMLFLLFGAPDLAFTQFMVETLSVVILALVMTRLDLTATDRRRPRRHLIDLAVALACGMAWTALLLRVLEQPFDPSLSTFFSAYAQTLAHGANVVNVIIVDFRALDTLGEIAVVTIAGIAILALIRMRGERHRPPLERDDGRTAEGAP